jgi:hypothetical protein
MTAKLLFKNKSFGGQNVTLLPNNKTQPQNIDEHIIRRAEDLARSFRGEAIPAFKLIHFDNKLRNPIMSIFGRTVF